ncbi:hypothetical protein THMIRHAS_09600 [Thiosulfatimonas sediminis]|uniref:PPM-type phosphatase domain-containing protein n=1 Tax=Thiosulfatimonas sediminis TaxID=2675054 RepID=A0A6F8PU81_9GAMM|nr:SpoIIE family protein phosphatase [Thiosulfatimonas sediminis]BBP45587.1 hypothetical protein THMIRHAS_09600 [Thiosulfatimonas sediminis]
MNIVTNCFIRPLVSQETCGDFMKMLPGKRRIHFIVGDVSGHGSPLVYAIAREVEQCFEQCYRQPLAQQYAQIAELGSVAKYGMTLCLGFFDLERQALFYLAVGNLRLCRLNEQQKIDLPVTEGVVGIFVPSEIQEQILPLQAGDRVLVTSDGVSQQALSLFTAEQSVETLKTQFLDDSITKQDDAICVCFDIVFE